TSLAYNVPQIVRLEGKLEINRLKDAFGALIARHESLRTSIVVINEEAVQVVHREVDFEIEYFEAAESEASSIIHAFIRPFDLGRAPLMRVGLIRLSAQSHLLLVDL